MNAISLNFNVIGDNNVESVDKSVEVNRSVSSSGGGRAYAQSDKGDRLAQVMQEAHIARKERDDAVYRLEQVQLVILIDPLPH